MAWIVYDHNIPVHRKSLWLSYRIQQRRWCDCLVTQRPTNNYTISRCFRRHVWMWTCSIRRWHHPYRTRWVSCHRNSIWCNAPIRAILIKTMNVRWVGIRINTCLFKSSRKLNEKQTKNRGQNKEGRKRSIDCKSVTQDFKFLNSKL